jgi:hypothetical protein
VASATASCAGQTAATTGATAGSPRTAPCRRSCGLPFKGSIRLPWPVLTPPLTNSSTRSRAPAPPPATSRTRPSRTAETNPPKTPDTATLASIDACVSRAGWHGQACTGPARRSGIRADELRSSRMRSRAVSKLLASDGGQIGQATRTLPFRSPPMPIVVFKLRVERQDRWPQRHYR